MQREACTCVADANSEPSKPCRITILTCTFLCYICKASINVLICVAGWRVMRTGTPSDGRLSDRVQRGVMQQQGSPQGQGLAFDELQSETWNAGRGADRNQSADRVAGLGVTVQELQVAGPAVRATGHLSLGSSARLAIVTSWRCPWFHQQSAHKS